MIKRGLHKSLAEIGKIKTGFKGDLVKSGNGKSFQPPKKFDFFMITRTERGQDGNLIPNEEIMTLLGAKPRELKIRLPFDSIDKNFFTQYQAYSGGKKLCAGDGETATQRGTVTVKGDKLDVQGDTVSLVPCDYETCPIAQAGKCKVSGILSCFLPQSGDLGGVFKFRTHSWNAVSSILGALEYFAANTGGILQGLPLKLVMIKKTTEEHGTINYATVVIDGEEIRGLRRLAIEERESRKLLGFDIKAVEAEAAASGLLEDNDPEEEVEAEFYTYTDKQPAPEKGTSADDLAAKMAARAEAEDVEARPVKEQDTNEVPPVTTRIPARAATPATTTPNRAPGRAATPPVKPPADLGLEEPAPKQSAPVAPSRGPAVPPTGKAPSPSRLPVPDDDTIF